MQIQNHEHLPCTEHAASRHALSGPSEPSCLNSLAGENYLVASGEYRVGVYSRVSEKRRTAGCAGPLGCRVRHGDVAAGTLGTICYLKPLQVLAHRATGAPRAVGELLSCMTGHRARTSGIGLHHTRID